MDDVRAVMDAEGWEKASLLGFSEGAPMSLLFAATYPKRVTSLVLYGAMARSTEAPDYPYAAPYDALVESALMMSEHWSSGAYVEPFAPSVADDPEAIRVWAAQESTGASPDQMTKHYLMFLEVDVRHVLPTIQAPTLVVHKHGDRVVSVHAGRWLASQIQGAKFVEFPGSDHTWQIGEDPMPIIDEIEELTGVRPMSEPDRVLATVMFYDIVSSTEKDAKRG